MFKKKQAPNVIDFLEKYFFIPDGDCQLVDFKEWQWQKESLQSVFHTLDEKTGKRMYTSATVSLARQQGKSIWLQMAACYMLLCGGTNLEMYSVSCDLDQANLFPDRLKRSIALSPYLSSMLTSTKQQIHCTATGNTLHTMASHQASAPGIIASVLFLDELGMLPEHQWPLIHLLLPAMSSRSQPLLLVGSTVGASEDGPLYDIMELSRQGLDDHAYLFYSDEILSPLTNMDNVARDKLLLPAAMAARQYRNTIISDSSFLTDEDIAGMIDVGEDYPTGRRVFIGCDYGLTRDRCVVASVIKAEDGMYHLDEVHAWQGSRSSPVELSQPLEVVKTICSQPGTTVEQIYFDKWQSVSAIQELKSEGRPAKGWDITAGSRPKLFKNLLTLIRDKSFRVRSDVLGNGCWKRNCETCPAKCGDRREMLQHDFLRELTGLRADSNFRISHKKLGDDITFAVGLALIAAAESYTNSTIRMRDTIYWNAPKPAVAPGTIPRRPHDRAGTWTQVVDGHEVLYWCSNDGGPVRYALDGKKARRQAYSDIYGR